MAKLDGKIALVTGGNSGIGRAIVRQFVTEGAKVVVGGRNPETLASLKEELGEAVVTVQGDVREQATRAALLEATQALGGIDVLVANAGIAVPQPIQDVAEDWTRAMFDTNVWAPYFLTQAASNQLKPGASVIFTASIAGELGMPGMSIYSATKAALSSFVRTFAVEWAGRGIRVNGISPGPIATPIYDRMGLPKEVVDEFATQLKGRVPLGRFGNEDEVAGIAVFLAGSDASYITGEDIRVDGGMRIA